MWMHEYTTTYCLCVCILYKCVHTHTPSVSAPHLRSWQRWACCPFSCWRVGHRTNTAGLWSRAPPWDREDLRKPCAPHWPSDIVSHLGQACMAVYTRHFLVLYNDQNHLHHICSFWCTFVCFVFYDKVTTTKTRSEKVYYWDSAN